MRTGHSLTVCCSLLPGGGGSGPRGVGSGPQGGGVWSPGGWGLVPGGVCLVWRRVPGPGGVSAPRGVSALGGVYPSMHWGRHPPPPVDRILDTRLWKYYLGPTSLRSVKIFHPYFHSIIEILMCFTENIINNGCSSILPKGQGQTLTNHCTLQHASKKKTAHLKFIFVSLRILHDVWK